MVLLRTMLTGYLDIVAVARPFSETVVSGTLKFGDGKRFVSAENFDFNRVGATLSPRHTQGEAYCGEQGFDDYVNGRSDTKSQEF